jgi:hypothetical protein
MTYGSNTHIHTLHPSSVDLPLTSTRSPAPCPELECWRPAHQLLCLLRVACGQRRRARDVEVSGPARVRRLRARGLPSRDAVPAREDARARAELGRVPREQHLDQFLCRARRSRWSSTRASAPPAEPPLTLRAVKCRQCCRTCIACSCAQRSPHALSVVHAAFGWALGLLHGVPLRVPNGSHV